MIYVNMKGDTARARKCHEGIAQALTALGDDLHALRNSRYPERYEMLMLAARRIDAAEDDVADAYGLQLIKQH